MKLPAIKKAGLLAYLMMLTSFLHAGSMSDFFNANQKYYVVIAVISIIFVGIIVFLIYLERKIDRFDP